MFITETYDLTLKISRKNHQKFSKQSKYFQVIDCPENNSKYYF